ncbi:MAG: bacteriocin [Bacteroidaceae bacterium]|nr:bacteriocin [Bacteroidaceae bacterium]
MDKKEKRVVQIEIDDYVKRLTIEGVDKDAQVVMRKELSDDELDQVTGGTIIETEEPFFAEPSDEALWEIKVYTPSKGNTL